MSGLFSAVGRGLSSAGYAAGDLYGKQALQDSQSELEIQKEMRLTEFRERMKNAPLERLGAKARGLASQDVPLEASAVSRLTGAGVEESSGLQGDPSALRTQISKWGDGPDKTAALAQIDRQFAADGEKNAEAVRGKTRKRTAEEAFDGALMDAKISDPVAYAAGRPLAAERTVTVPDGATVIDRNGKVIFSSAGVKDEREARREDRKDERERERQAAAETRQDKSIAAAEERQRRILDAAEARHRADGKVPSGYRTKSDGSDGLEPIPGGPADPNTKPAGGKPLNEGQAKALLFGTRMLEANAILDNLEKDGKVLSTPGSKTPFVGAAVNLVNSKGGQMLDQAKRNFINAALRRESGAVIAESEFDNGDKQYFPMAGDSKEVIAQKRDNRELATRGILAEVPDADARVARVRGGGDSVKPAASSIDDLLKKYGGK